ncbi:mitochondrial ribosomal protein MRP51 [Hypoxylon sp. NC1633]|nr:mitochondrial ribosomal protein MRP51 [Hypoxylon sp. NC1633]
MAGRSVSPGAALLRSSRMFSMPTPIPAPPGDYSAATKHYSATATINYPTHLTVTTTFPSRLNGDWGFKRPFPLKTTMDTTFPLVRIKQVDSVEHVTDFRSASDHTMTLKKYQEMNLPISVPTSDAMRSHDLAKFQVSVFEESFDVTALDQQQKVELANKRWKFTGPWLAGMTDGDFSRYLEKQVRGRRTEFRAYLRETLAVRMSERQARRLSEAGESELPAITAGEVTDSQLLDYQKELRQDRFTLYNLVSQFLDLAPVDPQTSYYVLGKIAPGEPKTLDRVSPYGQEGPPITHPSAGLSYLRTRNFQENHALYGPQKDHPPVKARVLKPINSETRSFKARIGVAGFVGSTPAAESVFNMARSERQSKFGKVLHHIELEHRGGSKIYVNLNQATVSSTGAVCINIGETKDQAEVVQKELMGESTVFEDELRAMQTPNVPRNRMNGPRSFSARPGSRIGGSASAYGLRDNIYRERS